MNRAPLFRFARTAAAAVALIGMPVGAAPSDGETRRAVIVVIENGATVQEPERMLETARHLLGQITELRRRRATRESEISIILTANPAEVSWSGTPGQLLEQAQGVLDLIAVRRTCSDLVLAWQQAETVLRITMPDEVRLYGIGPGIHAGFPCDGADQTITLPQAVPEGLVMAELAGQAEALRLMNVHPDQDEMLLAYLEAGGVLEQAAGGALEFDLMDAARTQANLSRLYDGRTRR